MRLAVSSLVCIASLAFTACSDSPAQARARNEQYLDRLAAIVCAYHAKNQKLPQSFDDALAASGQRLQHRGDYYGRSYHFQTFKDSAFFFRASDVEVSYVNCEKVSHAALVDWVRTHSSDDEWEVRRESYDP